MLKLGKKSSVDLLSGDEGWVIFKFSVPIILSYLLQQIYTISDAAICGQTLGVDDIAGVNDVFPILFIFLQFAVGCTAGFSVITSIAAGRGDQARVRRSFAAQLVLGGVLSLTLTGVAVLTLKPLLRFIGLSEANPGVWRAAYQYSLVIFLGIFAQLYYNLICSVLRSLGDSTTPLMFLLFSTVLNIGLDLLFILAFRLGVIGAAAATVLAQAVSALLCLIYAFGKYPELHLSGQDFRAEFSVYAQHLSQGLPMGLQFSVLAIGIIVMQRALVGFDIGPDGIMAAGNPAQNGFGAANKLNNFLMCPMNALSTAIVSFNAQNLGAGRHDRIRRGTVKSLLIGLAMYLILGGIGMLLTIRGAYQYLFMSADKITAATIRYGNLYLYVDLSMYFALMVLFVFRSGVQGVGHAEFTLVAGCAELIARVLICAFLPKLVNGGALAASGAMLLRWYPILCTIKSVGVDTVASIAARHIGDVMKLPNQSVVTLMGSGYTWLFVVYTILLFCAFVSTSVTLVYSMIQRFEGHCFPKAIKSKALRSVIVGLVVIGLCYAVSLLGLSTIISKIYGYDGYYALIVVVLPAFIWGIPKIKKLSAEKKAELSE